MKFSSDNIKRSQSERGASKDMRNNIELLMNRVITAVTNQWNLVNSSFNDRMKEYLEAKNKLQLHLSKVRQFNFLPRSDKQGQTIKLPLGLLVGNNLLCLL